MLTRPARYKVCVCVPTHLPAAAADGLCGGQCGGKSDRSRGGSGGQLMPTCHADRREASNNLVSKPLYPSTSLPLSYYVGSIATEPACLGFIPDLFP